MSRHFDRWTTIERDGEEIEILVEFTATPFIPAQTYGPPESCSPAEGGEIEITAVLWQLCGDDFVSLVLTEDEESKVLDYLYESLSDEDFDDGPDWDHEYDRARDDRLTGGDA